MKKPLISVIIPTYNEAPTLGLAIQSIIEQTYKNLEIIVIDDESNDNTKDVVRQYEKKDYRVRYFKNHNKDKKRVDFRGTNISVGYEARNLGMEKSSGEWITFQDADDASLLNRIEIQLTLAAEHNAVAVTTSWLKFEHQRTGKILDLNNFLNEHKKSNLIIFPEEISRQADQNKGILMNSAIHRFIPFVFKKRLPTKKFFIRSPRSYPGADSAPFFKRETIKDVRFRRRDEREWPALSGRGVSRDHLFQLAEKYKRNYSFNIPLYLWHQAYENQDFINIDKYLI